MSVDFYTCESCGETFSDCGDYVSCHCGNSWCSEDCASEDGYEEYDEEHYSSTLQKSSCAYCRGEKFTDTELLEFVMGAEGLSRDIITQSMKLSKLIKDFGGI